ncbi:MULTISPECIES: acyl-CoA thioesterase [Methylomicrobium]|uniref:Putative thioesterase n=1 Tax=Methylomicrobium album BG8 TaxID=686340 RepID=H8GNK1_METAL|nr:putative thioesterase [Methylomicrobium album BG8]
MQNPIYCAEIDLKIPFHDADMMEIVWHGHYAKYFEIARCELLDRIDYNYLAMRDSGYDWPIIDLRIRYIKPAVFGRIVTVRAFLAEWEHRLKIDYSIIDAATGAKLAKGHTVQVAVDRRNREMCLESPPVLLKKLGVKP